MFEDFKDRLNRVLEVVRGDMATVKTGRAKPSLVEHIKVEAYPGTFMQLLEVASISAPDAHLLVVQPWDKGVMPKIEAALAKSELGINPVVDGNIIRIAIPALTEERRLDLVKLIKQKLESGRELLRRERMEMKRKIDGKKDEADVSEDNIKAWLEEMQKHFEASQSQLEKMGEDKEKELMTI